MIKMMSMGGALRQSQWLFLSLVTLVILICPFWLTIYEGKRCDRCEMSLTFPNYVELSSNLANNPYAYKYRFFRYYEGWKDEWNLGAGCTPVLFIPGSAGNYKQLRSLASRVLTFRDSRNPSEAACFQFYTVDFMDEFVAFNPRLLRQQAHYVNDAIRLIVRGHAKGTDSIILVGHSFGGIVLRIIQTLDNYPARQGPNQLVFRPFTITLASPHTRPPLRVSSGLDFLYEAVTKSSVNLSVSSGPSDTLVPAPLSLIQPIVPGQLALNLRAEDISITSSHPNHVALIWERAVLSRLAILFHGLTSKGSLKSSQDIEKWIKQEVQVHHELEYKIRKPQNIQCDTLMNIELSSNESWQHSRRDICGNGELSKRFRCMAFSHLGMVRAVSDMEHPSGFTAQLGRELVRVADNQWTIESNPSLFKQLLPGRTYKLTTTTGATTGFTEIITKLIGNSRGVLLVQVDCNNDLVLGHSENEWSDVIDNWPLHYDRFRNNSYLHVSIYDFNVGKVKISPWNLVLGKTITKQASLPEVELIIPKLGRSISLEFTSNLEIISVVAVYSQGDRRRYAIVHSQLDKYGLVLEPGVHQIRVSFRSPDEGWLQIKPRLLHTFILSLIDDPNRMFVELYAAAILASSGLALGATLGLLTVRDIILEYPNGLLAILLTILKSVWVATACFLIVKILTRRTVKSVGKRWIVTLLIIGLVPLTTEIKVILQSILILVAFMGLTSDIFTLLVALSPHLLKAIFDFRNAIVLSKELGLRTALFDQQIFTLIPSVVSFIAVGEILVKWAEINYLTNKNNNGTIVKKTLIVRRWAIVLAIISHLLTKPYYLPIIHITVLLLRIQ